MPQTQGSEVVILGEDGTEHVFPSGFDPKQAAGIVRQGKGSSSKMPTKEPSVGAAPSSLWDVSRATAGAAGAMLGGVKGMAMGAPAGPVGAFVGGVAGAGVGAFGGEAFEMALETLWRKLKPGTPLQPISPTGAVQRLGSSTQTAMASQVAGEAITAVGAKAIAPFKSKLAPYAQEALSTFKTASGKSAILPSEISKSRALGIAENVAEGSILGGGGSTAVRESRQRIAETKVMDVLDRLGTKTTAREAGTSIQRRLPVSPVTAADNNVERLVRQRVAAEAARDTERTALRSAGSAQASTVASRLGAPATPQQAGQAVRSARAAAIQKFRVQERVAWKTFEEHTDTIPIETPTLDAFVESLPNRERGQLLPDAGSTAAKRLGQLTGAATEGVESAPQMGRQIAVKGGKVFIEAGPSGKPFSSGVKAALKQLGQEEGEVPLTVRQFQRTVSDLGRLQRGLEQSAKLDPSKYNAQLGLVKKLHELARADLEGVLTKVSAVEPTGAVSPGSPLELYREATTLTRLGNERLFNEEVRRVVRQSPEKVTTSLLRPNNSTAITMTTQAVGQEAMGPVRRVALDQIIAPDPVTKEIPWRSVVKRLATLGDDTTQALFPNGEAAGVRRIAESVIASERLLTEEAKAEVGALSEARSAVRAARRSDPFEPFRKVSPEKVTSQLFQRDNVTAVEAIKTIVGENGFRPIQRVAMERVLNPDPTSGQIDWTQVLRRLNRLDDQTLNAFFPGGHADEVKRVAGLMAKLKVQPVGGMGKVGIMLTQWGVTVGAATGHLPPSAGMILLGPAAVSRVFSSPVGLRWLSTGLEAPAWSAPATKAASQLVGFLWQSAQEDKQRAPTQE